MPGPALGTSIHLLPIFLILEDNGDVVRPCFSKGSVWRTIWRDRVRRTIPPTVTLFVRPGRVVFEYSQDRIAKKKAPRTRSAVCRCTSFLVSCRNR
jgi:hypothetical protein